MNSASSTGKGRGAYYFLRQDLFDATDIIEVSGHTEETGKHLWTEGVRFTEPVPVQTLALDAEYGTQMADFFDTTIPLMSDRLIKALLAAGVDNFDAYPMILQRSDTGEQRTDYKAMNFIGRIDALDRAKSECEEDDLGALECTGSISLDSKRVGDAICFRLLDGPDLLVIHEKIAREIRKQEFSALLIQKTEDYDGD
jgi:uncharacterized protein DUF1629